MASETSRRFRWSNRATRLGSSPAAMIAARGPVLASGLLVAPVLARALGPADRGYAAATTAALAMCPVVVGLGVPMAVRREASLGREGAALRGARTLVPLQMVAGGIIAALLAPLVLPGASGSLRGLFVAAMALSTAYVEVLNTQSVLIARKTFGAVAAIQSCQPICYAAGIIAGWLAGALSIGWVLGSYAVSVVCNVVLGETLVGIRIRGPRMSARGLARRGLPFAGAQTAEIASSRIDTVLTVSVLGAHEAGLYAVATMLGSLPVVLAQAVGAAVFADHARRPTEERKVAAAAVVRMALTVGAIAGVALSVLTPIVVPLIFGREFRGATVPAIILAAGAPALVTVAVSGMLLSAGGSGHRATAVQATAAVFDVGLLYALGPAWGSAGAAVASFGSSVVAACVAIRLLQLRAATIYRPRRADLRAVRQLLGGQ